MTKSIKDIQDLISSNSSIAQALSSTNRMQDMLGSNAMAETLSATKRMQDLISPSSSIAQALSSTNRMQNMLGSNAMAETLSATKRMQDFISPSSSIAQALSSTNRMQDMLGSNAMAETLNATKRMQELVRSSRSFVETLSTTNHLQNIVSSSALSEAINSTKRMQDMINSSSTLAEIIGSSNKTREVINSLATSSAFKLSLSAIAQVPNFSSAIDAIESEIFNKEQIQSKELDFEQANTYLKTISKSESTESFDELFSRSPYILKLILIFTILQIVLPQINSISANLLTPYVDEYISDDSLSKREKILTLKKMDFNDLELPSKELRFISGQNVWLRNEPSIKSETIDMLGLGQLVVFMEKKRNWTKVMVQYEDGNIIGGWVFTRYVTKFIK